MSLLEMEKIIQQIESAKARKQLQANTPAEISDGLKEHRAQFDASRTFEDDEEWLPLGGDSNSQEPSKKDAASEKTATKEKGETTKQVSAPNVVAKDWGPADMQALLQQTASSQAPDTLSQTGSSYYTAVSDKAGSEAQYSHTGSSSPGKSSFNHEFPPLQSQNSYAQTGGYYRGPSPERKSAYTYPQSGYYGGAFYPGQGWNPYSGYH